MNKVEKDYEELLKTADSIAEIYDKDELSDEDVEKIFNILNEQEEDPAQSFPSNNGVLINEKLMAGLNFDKVPSLESERYSF